MDVVHCCVEKYMVMDLEHPGGREPGLGAGSGFADSAVVRHRWSDELAPPTVADAVAAAGALAELGAARVLLYGSVAAGT